MPSSSCSKLHSRLALVALLVKLLFAVCCWDNDLFVSQSGWRCRFVGILTLWAIALHITDWQTQTVCPPPTWPLRMIDEAWGFSSDVQVRGTETHQPAEVRERKLQVWIVLSGLLLALVMLRLLIIVLEVHLILLLILASSSEVAHSLRINVKALNIYRF